MDRVGGSRGWRDVPTARIWSEEGWIYARGRRFVVWRALDRFAGVFVTGPQHPMDIDEAWSVLARIGEQPGTHALFNDARGFRPDGSPAALFQHMILEGPHVVASTRSRVSRSALVLPRDWTSAWWRGAIEQLGWAARIPTRICHTCEDAWQWLDAPEGLAEAVEALRAHVANADDLRARAETALRAAPELDLDGVARATATSRRSLQRALARVGETFAELRTRVRVEHARAQLAAGDQKLDAIAAAVGFRSRSHFVAWFRAHAGITPGSFRDRERETPRPRG